MSVYVYFDRLVRCSIALPELPVARPSDGEQVTISLGETDGKHFASDEFSWYDNTLSAEVSPPILYGQKAHKYMMRFPQLVDFIIDPANLEIRWPGNHECPPSTLRHLLLDQVLPRLLGQRGELVVHAGMVGLPRATIAFAGRSGWGKSTLVTSFADHSAITLGDDALLLNLDRNGAPIGVAAYSGARLWPDTVDTLRVDPQRVKPVCHYSAKQRVEFSFAASSANMTTPLRALFILNDPEESPATDIQIQPLGGNAALMAVMQRCFLLNSQDMDVAQTLWRGVGKIIRAGLPVYELSYPRQFEQLPTLRAAIVGQLQDIECNGSAALA